MSTMLIRIACAAINVRRGAPAVLPQGCRGSNPACTILVLLLLLLLLLLILPLLLLFFLLLLLPLLQFTVTVT